MVDKESSAPASEFYQIAGRTVSEGMIRRQKSDLGMSIGLGYRAGGQSGLNVKIDYLTKIKTRGTSHYALIDASVNGYRPQKYYDKHGNAPATGEIPTLITAVDAGIGYGIGFRATRYFEIMPHAIVGMAMLFSENNLTDDSALTTNENGELSFLDKTGWFATAGLRLNINVYYPVQIYGGADFTFCFGASDWYLENYEHLKNMGKQRQGLGLFAGVRITF